MTHHRTTQGRTRRNRFVAGAIAAVLLPLGIAGTAVAGGDTSESGQQSTERQQTAGKGDDTPQVVDKVRNFYRSYVTALGEGDQTTADSLRTEALTTDFQKRLTAWEKKHAADGVTRSQNVPVDVSVKYDGSGAGHSLAIVTLKWDGDSKSSKLHVRTDLPGNAISDIRSLG